MTLATAKPDKTAMSQHLDQLLGSLLSHPRETEWIEFKHNNGNPEEIGEYISALSNSAALLGKEAAYLIWGVQDGAGSVVGTTFSPRSAKVGNEELENWLNRGLHPHVDFVIHEWLHAGKPVALFIIKPCRHSPVRFKDTEFIRVGTYKKSLKEYPEKERELWLRLSRGSFEEGVARDGLADDDVLRLLDYLKLLELLNLPPPANKSGILEKLRVERLAAPQPWGKYAITNLGAVLFAHDLRGFEGLGRKILRVIHYNGENRRSSTTERELNRGYATGFEEIVAYINDIRADDTHTRLVLFAPQPLGRMDRKDKIRACYQHCCLRHVSNQVMTNTSLRERFSIPEKDYPVASRIIRDTVSSKLIKPEDPDSKSRKHAKYVPYWA